MDTQKVKLSQVTENVENPRTITDRNLQKLITSILVFPKMLALRPIVVDDTMTALGGNMRLRALSAISTFSPEQIANRLQGCLDYEKKTPAEREALINYWRAWLEEPTTEVANDKTLTEDEKRAFIIKDNVAYGEWDEEALSALDEKELEEWGVDMWDEKELDRTWESDVEADSPQSTAQPSVETPPQEEHFYIPMLSFLDTRQGYWQARKKQWTTSLVDCFGSSRDNVMGYGLAIRYPTIYSNSKNERKRLGISFKEYFEKYVPEEMKKQTVVNSDVSLFDPVLAEIMCKWYTPHKGATIFDCFAGDTRKGQVFAMCGYEFCGIELRPEQVEINQESIKELNLPIRYICDDGRNVAQHFEEKSQDLLFSCPPYYDLEVYSDRADDASNQATYEEFLDILRTAFSQAITRLKDNRFAVIVIGDVRNKRTGCYLDFVSDVKRIFIENGMGLYNELFLIEQITSKALRASGHMKTRKVAKCHQNVLVFYKGDARKIKDHFPEVVSDPEDEEILRKTLGME